MNGAIIWEGLSKLDGRTPVVCIATGLGTASSNPKTGAMVQTWILLRDESPVSAIKDTAHDSAICGQCPHRGDHGKARACYVNIMGPQSVWRAYKRGAYPRVKAKNLSGLLSGRPLRLGSYGDPAALPSALVARLVKHANNNTGYTHQWRHATELQPYVMASVDSETEAREAWANGWRTFRVRAVSPDGTPDPLLPGEVICPASDEGRHRTTCERCGLCKGTRMRARSIAIVNHSASARARTRRRLAVVAA